MFSFSCYGVILLHYGCFSSLQRYNFFPIPPNKKRKRPPEGRPLGGRGRVLIVCSISLRFSRRPCLLRSPAGVGLDSDLIRSWYGLDRAFAPFRLASVAGLQAGRGGWILHYATRCEKCGLQFGQSQKGWTMDIFLVARQVVWAQRDFKMEAESWFL